MIRSATPLLLLVALFALVSRVPAQSQPTKPVNPAIDTVTSRLRALTRLPADEWRYHNGDLPQNVSIGEDHAGEVRSAI